MAGDGHVVADSIESVADHSRRAANADAPGDRAICRDAAERDTSHDVVNPFVEVLHERLLCGWRFAIRQNTYVCRQRSRTQVSIHSQPAGMASPHPVHAGPFTQEVPRMKVLRLFATCALTALAITAVTSTAVAQGGIAPNQQFGIGINTNGFQLQYALSPGMQIGMDIVLKSGEGATGYGFAPYFRALLEGTVNPFIQAGLSYAR